MNPAQGMEKANILLAHLWMVRTFLKHSEDIQEDEEMLAVHRTIFDSIRALEPSYQRQDAKEYWRRLKGKIPKLRKSADFFASEYRRITDHTNFQMAALSLQGAVSALEELARTIEPESRADSPMSPGETS